MGWANIRSGPSMDYEVLRSVPTDYPLLVIDQQQEWSQVEDYRKRRGWVATRLLAESNSVILKISKGKLRRGPSMDENIVKKVEYGDLMEVREIQGDWLRVVDKNGDEGWLPRLSIWPDGSEF